MPKTKRRIRSGPVAASRVSKETTSNPRLSAGEFRECLPTKHDPKLWDIAKLLPTEELETETNPERRRNIEACLENVKENGSPFPDEVYIAMDGVVKHVTERECEAMDWAWLTASGKKDEAFCMLGPDYELGGNRLVDWYG